jgi:membrane protein
MIAGADLTRGISRQVWERDLASAPAWRRAGVMTARVLSLALRGWDRHEVLTRAAALTYVTVFGLVPTLAVALAMFKAFGGLEQAKDVLLPRILAYLAVGVHETVRLRIEDFIANIHGGALGGAGTVFLLLAVVSLLGGIEQAFNAIWEVARSRTFFQRVTTYWTITTVTPALLIAGLALPAAVRRLAPVDWVLAWTGGEEFLFGVLLPLLFVWAAFTLLYKFVPNTWVDTRAAVGGALVAGSLWIAAVWGYALYARQAVSYSNIYGSLAALPIFLLWIYVTWVIVLLGAEIAFAAQHVPTTPVAPSARPLSVEVQELLALRLMVAVARRFVAGEPAPTTADLGQETQAPPAPTQEAVERLRAAGLLVASEDDARLFPARDPERTSPADVLLALRRHGEQGAWTAEERVAAELGRWRRTMEEAVRGAWGGMSLADLAGEGRRDAR